MAAAMVQIAAAREHGGVGSMSPSNSTTLINPREERGLRIAARPGVQRQGAQWVVPSESSKAKYKVDPEAGWCTCPDYEVRRQKCKHLWAVEYTIKHEVTQRERTTRRNGQVTKTLTTTVKSTKTARVT